jgi:hypothetical protein
LSNDDIIPLLDSGLDHAVALHPQGEVRATTQERRTEAEKPFLILHRQQRLE